MTTEVGPIDPRSAPWPALSAGPVLVFGGVILSGDRRARELVKAAVRANSDVVWFDAYERCADTHTPSMRRTLDVETDRSVVVIGCRELEGSTLPHRVPSKVGKLIAKAFRGRAAWSVLEPTVRAVAEHVPEPTCIVYADAHSLALAWNSARSIWPDVPAHSDLVLGSRPKRQPGR